MKSALAAATVLAGLAATASFAGNVDNAVIEPAPTVTQSAGFGGGTWDGFYGGAQIGFGGFDGDDAFDSDDTDALGGIHAGWQGSTGLFVYGAEVDYNYGELDLGEEELNNLTRLKAKAGYDLGETLVYGTVGGAYAELDGGSSDWGYAAGVGVDHFITDQITLGGEVIYQSFDDFDDTGSDIDGTTFGLKLSYHF